MSTVDVDALLQVEQPDESLAPFAVVADLLADNDVALPVLDAGARTQLAAAVTALGTANTALAAILTSVDGLEGSTDGIETALGTLATQTTLTAVLAAVDGLEGTLTAVLAVVDGLEGNTTGLATQTTSAAILAAVDGVESALAPLATQSTLAAVLAAVDGLDIRALTDATDSVRSVDAAEDVGLTAVPFTITATGVATLVAAPGGASRLRLRRISPTYAVRSPDSEPILALFVGAVEAQRGNALTGRFDITTAAGTDAITLNVDILDTGGKVAGTVYYELV